MKRANRDVTASPISFRWNSATLRLPLVRTFYFYATCFFVEESASMNAEKSRNASLLFRYREPRCRYIKTSLIQLGRVQWPALKLHDWCMSPGIEAVPIKTEMICAPVRQANCSTIQINEQPRCAQTPGATNQDYWPRLTFIHDSKPETNGRLGDK